MRTPSGIRSTRLPLCHQQVLVIIFLCRPGSEIFGAIKINKELWLASWRCREQMPKNCVYLTKGFQESGRKIMFWMKKLTEQDVDYMEMSRPSSRFCQNGCRKSRDVLHNAHPKLTHAYSSIVIQPELPLAITTTSMRSGEPANAEGIHASQCSKLTR